MKAKCPKCGGEPISCQRRSTTLVGYITMKDVDGRTHNHDDNCLEIEVTCPEGHRWVVSPIRRCNDEIEEPAACDWTGHTSCDICRHEKVEIGDMPGMWI